MLLSIKSMKLCVLVLCILILNSCAASHTMIKKRKLDIQTKMSDTIFLEPVSPSQRTIFIDIRNTSDKNLNIVSTIKNQITSHGYTIVDDPAVANYMLQANILQVGKIDLREASSSLESGFGGALGGAAIGAVLGGATHSSGWGTAGYGLLGGAIGVLGDALVDDVYYTMITDLQIRERPLKGECVTQSQDTNAKQGTATTLKQEIKSENVKWKIYRTRIVSTANKANLKFEEAKPGLTNGLVRSISGIF